MWVTLSNPELIPQSSVGLCIELVKRFCLSLIPAMALVLLWAVAGRADRVMMFRVQQSLLIRQVQGQGYRLQGDHAQIAHPRDRLDQIGAGVQTLNGKIVLRLDTQAGDLELAPHSRLRITNIQPHPQGGKRIYLKLEQGNTQMQLPPITPDRPTRDPARNLSGVRAALPKSCGYSTFSCLQDTTGYELATVA